MASTSSSQRHDNLWFPAWFIWALFVVTSALRVYYVLQPDNWWLVHADEVYQTMEVAHSEMYGYGFRTYEFNRPPVVQAGAAEARRQELHHGMFALRSFLLPNAYVMVTWVLQGLGFTFNPFVTWKVAHTLFASTLLLAVYRYAIVVFRSRDTACLAAILCAACAQLHVLGTHTLANSLLAPPVFLCLSQVHTLLTPDPETEDAAPDRDKGGQGGTNPNPDTRSTTSSKQSHRSPAKQPLTRKLTDQVTKRKAAKQKPHRKGSTGKPVSDSPNENGKHVNGTCASTNQSSGGGLPKGTEEEGGIDGFKTSRSSFSTISSKTQNSAITNGHAAVWDGNGEPSERLDSKVCTFLCVTKSLLQNFVAGFVLGVCVYVRIDVAALVVTSLVPHWRPFRTRYGDVIISACGVVGGAALGVLYDFWYYGWGVVTPYNWFRFNVERDYASKVFGSEASHKYVVDIFFHNVGMTALTVIVCLCAVSSVSSFILPSANMDTAPDMSSCMSKVSRTSASWLFLLTLYSLKGHKELRFVHNVIVLALITCAALLQSNLKKLPRSRHVLAAGVALFALSQWQDVSSLTNGPNRMAYQGSEDTQDVNKCLYLVSSQPDLTGVFIDKNIYGTGGYALLHRDVPVFAFLRKDIYEFRVEDRLTEAPRSGVGGWSWERNVSVSFMGRFSNYVTWTNSPQALKYVLQDPSYNYLVARSARDFSLLFGEAVFTCRKFKVYRRAATPTPQQALFIQQAVSLPLPANASTLLLEADMLFFHGAWARAAERYRHVLLADPARVVAYFPLAVSYYRLGDSGRSEEVWKECVGKFGWDECKKTRSPPAQANAADSG